jgi:membrane protein implicated in regulation of membrane protease activity
MKTLTLAAGIIACVVGLVWIGQGTGYFPYPERSFMISQMPWAYRGAVLLAIGVALVWFGRRRA